MKHHKLPDRGIDVLSLLRRRILRLTTGLILVWWIAIWWGESGIYSSTVSQCSWENWETWTTQAQPHHVLLIADPQLVDPHTYPGRPWPLSTLTILYTDLYLRRAYRTLQQTLRPDSTLFLGDLFDGGREWGTADYKSPEDRYKGYGDKFWRKEYRRFSNLFLQNWFHGSISSHAAPYGRRLIASVPGNHDQGFASGIDPAVKSRFDAFFGPLNRVDVLGNHSFVSLDTVSLSAMDQVDPNTGAHGGGDASASATAIQREYDLLQPNMKFPPDLIDLADPYAPSNPRHQPPTPDIPTSQFPTIILSHVPLFRPDNTPCGPHREGRPHIPLSAGYQYQNVLTPLISSDIIKHLNSEEIVQIYSGDDHDYCEITHSEYTGAIKEITVKSMSWAMGVRIPGVQLVSLWNPVDLKKAVNEAFADPDVDGSNPTRLPAPKDTLQNHLCLLPVQLDVFIRYAQLLGLTLVILAIDTVRTTRRRRQLRKTTPYDRSEPLLPLVSTTTTTNPSKDAIARKRSNSNSANQLLAATANGAATERLSARSSYGNLPASSRSASPAKASSYSPPREYSDSSNPFTFQSTETAASPNNDEDDDDDWGMPSKKNRALMLPPKGGALTIFGRKIYQVAWPVLLVYGWFLWRDREPGI
ncbi:Cell division control protein 1 [Cyphellophora attinorum]|uniref:Cell division control protein 1 n=1 Tax=Cyphellophora attinorum TaxID=1664694 RepID=A0A0N1GZ16_9EURO|nr:Cell division control protein 1 [Phialophora attinorum]KPI36126.1 Cell division control protein 1 [Phialophora attinorum]